MNTPQMILLLSISILFFTTQCCTSKENVKTENQTINRNNYPPPSLSRGTAEVSSTILKLVKEKFKTIGLFRIDSVHRYGPSTPPIGVGSQLEIEFSEILLKDNENEILEMFNKNSKHRLLIRSIRSGVKREDISLWQIISIK